MKNPPKDDSFEVVELYADSKEIPALSNAKTVNFEPTSAKEETPQTTNPSSNTGSAELIMIESPLEKSASASAKQKGTDKKINLANFSEESQTQVDEGYHHYVAYYRSEKFSPNSVPLKTATFGKIVWPTESTLFDSGARYSEFIQGTLGKSVESGLFGDVRNSGYRFHEGIDVKSMRRNKKGEPLDDVFAAMSGKIAVINKVAGNSSYGKYVVIVHENFDVPIYSLYAHLKDIDPWISVSKRVEAGQRVGTMGRTANYAIAKECAHMHFEVGLMYSSHFEKWYASKKFPTKNYFGNYNGMNLVGLDPLDFLYSAKNGKLNNGLTSFIKNQKTAFVLRYYTKKTPDFVKNYPTLVEQKGSKCGWDIYFTWWGFPHKMVRIDNPSPKSKDGDIEIIDYNDCISHRCAKFVVVDKKGRAKPTDKLIEILRKMF